MTLSMGGDTERDIRDSERKIRGLDMGLRGFVYLVWALAGLALEGMGFSRYGNDRLLLRGGVLPAFNLRRISITLTPSRYQVNI